MVARSISRQMPNCALGRCGDKQAVAEALEGVDIVIHCAAAVGVGQSMYRVQHYIDTNAGGMAALLEALIERKQQLQKLIVFTSMTGYGEGVYRRPSDGALLRVPTRTQADIARWGWDVADAQTGEVLEPQPTPEDSALLAQNVYALSKRWQEQLALSIGEAYDFPTTCLRLFNVYGPRQSLSNPYTGVLAIFLSRLLNGEQPVVYEDGRQSRDFVSVHDVVRATALAIAESWPPTARYSTLALASPARWPRSPARWRNSSSARILRPTSLASSARAIFAIAPLI